MRLIQTIRLGLILAGLSTLPSISPPVTAAPPGPSFEERVAAQRVIEEVYWRHRVWPKENPRPKPSLSAMMSEAAIRDKVQDYLRKSNALEMLWKRPVSGAQLQAELDRMSSRTRDPQLLRELFAALGSDPQRIASTLVRQNLVERLIRDWYATDHRLHGGLELRAREALARAPSANDLPALGGDYSETTYELRAPEDDSADTDLTQRSVGLTGDEWKEWSDRAAQWFGVATFQAIPFGRPSPLVETPDRFFAVALLARTEGRATIARVSWAKRSFDAWWAEASSGLDSDIQDDLGSMVLPTPTGGGCSDDTWALLTQTPAMRYGHSAVWTGTEMVVWGGTNGSILNTGGRYDPATDTWIATSIGLNVPAPRRFHTAVWTGTEMVIWGGIGSSYLNSGGRYNPATDTWAATSTGSNVPSARNSHTAVWTGTAMIVWGGTNGTYFNTGGRYDPLSDTWAPTSTAAPVPEARRDHTAVWTGTEMIVWGGGTSNSTTWNTGGRYDPATDTWAATSTGSNVPVSRRLHTAVWSGTKMIVWGGTNGTSSFNTGGRYDPATDTWAATSTGSNVPASRRLHTAVWSGTKLIVWGGVLSDGAWLKSGGLYEPGTDSWSYLEENANVPGARYFHTAVWTGTEMIVWGGNSYVPLSTGGRYDPATNTWSATSLIAPAPHYKHAAVWTGAEMIVWGGLDDNPDYTNIGARYTPATDSWAWTSTGANLPESRRDFTAVWTGAEMIVWGGVRSAVSSFMNTGGRYSPTTDTWTTTSTVGAPSSRSSHKAVWTGTEMIVWGGTDAATPLNTGGRYAPLTDTWTATSVGANVPAKRYSHTAVWTDKEMIVWGGNDNSGVFMNTGGRYDPLTDAWTPTSVGPGVPAVRERHSAVWNGTEMIVWGGNSKIGSLAVLVNTGGRYAPSTDSWTPTSVNAGVPATRLEHTAVWTGDEMIVWGGIAGSSAKTNTGGRYNPATDAWTATSSSGSNVPSPRTRHSAVWTGAQMIIWGGTPVVNEAGAYCATGCSVPIAVWRDSDGDGYGDPAEPADSWTCASPTGYVTNAGDCADADPDTYSSAPEVNDGQDNQCRGDAGYGVVDELSGPTGFCDAADKDRFCWEAQTGAAAYQVARASEPDFTQACTVFPDTAATYILDHDPVPPADVRFYLVRPRLPNPGSWGQASSGQERNVPCAP
jgi:N-acetylneuraminic acid mutarotase